MQSHEMIIQIPLNPIKPHHQGTTFRLAPDHHFARLRERAEGAAAGADLAHVDQGVTHLAGESIPAKSHVMWVEQCHKPSVITFLIVGMFTIPSHGWCTVVIPTVFVGEWDKKEGRLWG